jgi:hypothetical protein
MALQDATDVIRTQIKALEHQRDLTFRAAMPGRAMGVQDAIDLMERNVKEAETAMEELIQKHYPALHELVKGESDGSDL